MKPGYGTDLAYIHDAGHTGFARIAAPFLLDAIRKPGRPTGLVVDLGCGSGVWAHELTRVGYGVLGIDISPAMITLARSRAPSADFRIGSLVTAPIPSCVAVTALGECCGYLFDSRNSRQNLLRLFRRIHRALTQLPRSHDPKSLF